MKNNSNRIHGFDLLRGLCAILVAYYHVLYWTDTAQFLSWGRYGVYIFFALSGASIYIGYQARLEQGYSLGKFVLLRFVRLAPLYVFAVALMFYHSPSSQGLPQALLNVSLLFGFGMPGATSMVTGGWSLGIEFLFYLAFPIISALVSGRYWLLSIIASFILQHLYISWVLAKFPTLIEAWPYYTQFLSFVFYFVAGCGIGRLIQSGKIQSSAWWYMLFILVSVPLLGANFQKNLNGWCGIGLSICAVLIVLSAAYIPMNKIVEIIADYLGRASYGIYLLHPIIYFRALQNALDNALLTATLAVILSTILALLFERFVEIPIRNLARAATQK